MSMRFALLLSVAAAYCPGGNTITGDSNLGRVTLNGVQGTSISDTSDCPGGTGVIDLTSKSASLQPGGSYTLNFQATTCGGGWARLTFAYIDFDGNGVYDNSELLGQQNVDNRDTPIDVSFAFKPPCEGSGTKVGGTRMRVFVVESGFNTNPCQSFSYGGVKEFSINMISSPGAACGGSDMSTGDGGMSGGSKFLLSLFIILLIYFLGSAIWVLKIRPDHRDKIWFAPLTKQFWVSLVGLVKAGCLFTKAKIMQLAGKGSGNPNYTDVI